MPTLSSSTCLNTNSDSPIPSIALYLSMIITILNLLLSMTIPQASGTYQPTDVILLNCGESSPIKASDGRTWEGDTLSRFLPSNASMLSETSSASSQDSSVNPVPYMTARLIHSNFTYNFPVVSGPKFVRLYFYPAAYSSFNCSASFFSVTANGYTLLSNFSAYLTVSSINHQASSFFKEFVITVWETEQLKITFTPSQSSFAFVNGLEIVSMPSNLYTKDSSLISYPLVNNGDLFYFDNTTALEISCRLNVGGFVASVNDSGMFRTWLNDTDFILGNPGVVHWPENNFAIRYTTETPEYVAPPIVYRTKRTMGNNNQVNLNSNLTWLFTVDSGFNYLFRLHFCESEAFVEPYQRVFYIFINNMTAERQLDVMAMSGGRGFPMYRDYVVFVPSLKGITGKVDLRLDLHPNIDNHPNYYDAILNGLEIFKLNRSDGVLAGPNPELPEALAPPESAAIRSKKKKGKRFLTLIIPIGAAAIAFSTLLVICFFIYQRRRKMEDHVSSLSSTTRSTTITMPSLPIDLCRLFTLDEMREATKNFDVQNLIGFGGFGNVYKGYLQPGSIPVAIKRLDSSSKQGMREFHTEIKMLSSLRHVHLVSLIGYCEDQSEMILVYEYMPNGSLKDHLYKTEGPPLKWKQRLEICLGAARGLHYLHTGSKNTIIHRDVKSPNILLDGKLVAKVSDFGLSKIGPTSLSQTHVSTIVRGSFGYIDPEYYRRQQLTEKSDVYSFGVVLFEVLCARRPLIHDLPKDQVNLAEWGKKCYRRGMLDRIMDKHLKGQEVDPVSLIRFGAIAESCLHEKGNERPTMGDVVWGLEFALQLQETADKNRTVTVDASQESPLLERREAVTTDNDEPFSSSRKPSPYQNSTFETKATSTDPSGIISGEVFSEIMDSRGR